MQCRLTRQSKASSEDLEQEKMLTKESPLHIRGKKAKYSMDHKLGFSKEV